jgi:hypothetical protein
VIDPDTVVWLTTVTGPAHKPARNSLTACGLPCTTSERRTVTGVSTIARYAKTLCPACWPNDEGSRA